MAKPTQQEMEEWFKELDADGSGKVDSSELRPLVKAFYDWQKEAVTDAKIDADVQVVSSTYCYKRIQDEGLRQYAMFLYFSGIFGQICLQY